MPRILFIDDDISVRFAAKALLEIEGYEVVVADNGRNGIEAIATIPFDAVIVDIFMPCMDGLRTIEALNRYAPDVPVIALSGLLGKSSAPLRPSPGESTRLLVACALRKPFRPRDLLSAIEACVCQDTAAAHSREPQSADGPRDRPSGI
ncbi:MAG: response regulator [Xanthobacteraceae bacterium]|jgi:CheY-like chemotaxis protein